MKRITLFPSAVVLLVFLSGMETQAATRVIQFAGITSAENRMARVIATNDFAVCTISIVNTGTTDQIIEQIQYLPWSGTNTTNFASARCQGGTALPTTIASQRSCVATFFVRTFATGNRSALCSGRIQVTDRDGAQPGSVVAAGSITINQEAVVLGGLLSGAYFASGSHRDLPQGSVADISTSGLHTGTMNVYCSQVCYDQSGTSDANRRKEVCNGLCGAAFGANTYYGKLPRAISGWVETDSTLEPLMPKKMVDAHSAVTTGSSYYAGGLVYEISIGPKNTICTGNPSFEVDGTVSVPANNSTDGFDSLGSLDDVLFCGHRNGQQDLHLSVGSNSSFAINGGMAF